MKIISARKGSGRPVTDGVFEEAAERGKLLYGSIPRASRVSFDDRKRELEISFEDQPPVRLEIGRLKNLAALSDDQLSKLKVGFAGKGLYLDEVEGDLHVSVQGLIAADSPRARQLELIVPVRPKRNSTSQFRQYGNNIKEYASNSSSETPKIRNWTIVDDRSTGTGVRAAGRIDSNSVLKRLQAKVSSRKKTRSE